MPNARAFDDANKLVDFTDQINNIPAVSTVIRELNIFKNYYISQTTVAFDKTDWEYALLTPVDRRSRETTVPAGRSSKTYAFSMPYFKHTDQITPEDLLSVRRVGTQADPVALAEIRADKLEVMRTQALQTQEYMKLSALQGVTITPDGDTVIDMFSEFGVSRPTAVWDFADSSKNPYNMITDMKNGAQKALRTGGLVTQWIVFCSDEFFKALTNHPMVRQTYLNSTSNQYLRDAHERARAFGITNVFEFNGVTFVTYPHAFPIRQTDGSISYVDAVPAGEAFVVPVTNGLFRAYYGPANKLHTVTQVGKEMFAWEYQDDKDEGLELQVEFAALYFCTQPQVLYKLTANYSADKDALNSAIAYVSTLTEADYTAATWTTLDSAVTSGQAVAADVNATQSEVDTATAAILDAIAGLVAA